MKVFPGNENGQLYSVLETTHVDLRDFGLGVAMYFEMLQLIFFSLFLCGIWQAQAIQYFKSKKYSDGQVCISKK